MIITFKKRNGEGVGGGQLQMLMAIQGHSISINNGPPTQIIKAEFHSPWIETYEGRVHVKTIEKVELL